MTKTTTIECTQPLLKWPGGKRFLLPHLLPLVPDSFNRYFEPFLGGGALFFALQPDDAVLADSNLQLIECYQAVRDQPHAVLQYLSQWPNSRRTYYRVRLLEPRRKAERAARVIYLTTLSFNGLYRVNQAGQFNVPYGWRAHQDVIQEEKIRAASRVLKRRAIHCIDFEAATKAARSGDFVYLDPPYTVTHGNNGFRRYNARVFSWSDQARLAEVAMSLAQRGCSVLMTNACHSSIRSLYREFYQITISRPSRMAASNSHRRSVRELLITNRS